MTLVERFIEIDRWPVSRKSALLNAMGLPVVVLFWAIIRVSADSEMVDLVWVDRLLGGYFLAHAVCFGISAIAARRDDDSLWTARLTMFLHGPFVFGFLYGMGLWTTGVLAMYPISVTFLALWFPPRIGWGAFIVGLAAFTLFTALEASGTIPHAPLLYARSIDAQQSLGWVVGIWLLITIFFGYCFTLCVLIVSARRLQDQRLQVAQKLIRRYVPSQVADALVSGIATATDKHERRNLTIFFSDVEGFTNASDELDPEQLAGLLNEYLSEMATIADRHGATINQFVGDGIMIFFGAPTATNDKDHALRAVRMSLEMQRRMAELQQHWFKRGFQRPFRIRIGINTGYASVGDFGSQGRAVYSAIGIQTNLAARIQSHCEPGKVLISHSTWALVHEEVACEPKGELQVKGIHYPVKVYEVAEAAA